MKNKKETRPSEVKLKEKQDFEDTKKTVSAHGIIDETEAEKMAEKTEEVTEALITDEEIKADPILKEIAEAVTKKKTEPTAERRGFQGKSREETISEWEPKTKLGIDVKNDKIKNIDEILDSGKKILEEQIVDKLLHHIDAAAELRVMQRPYMPDRHTHAGKRG